jgi:hypothetical protein
MRDRCGWMQTTHWAAFERYFDLSEEKFRPLEKARRLLEPFSKK